MKLYRLERTQTLPVDLNRAWDFFSNPRNLARITPTDLRLQIVEMTSETMHAGMIITYTVTPFGRSSWRWVTEITHSEPPGYFVDEQRFGPYRFWHHQHRLTACPDGTVVDDIVSYSLPFDPLSRLIQPLVAQRLQSIFDYRARILTELFPG